MTTLEDVTKAAQEYGASEVLAAILPLRMAIDARDAALNASATKLATSQARVDQLAVELAAALAKPAGPRWYQHAGNLTLAERKNLTIGEYVPGPATTGLLPGTVPSRLKIVRGLQTLEAGDPIADTYFTDGVVFAGRRDLNNCQFGGPKNAASSNAVIRPKDLNKGLYGSILSDSVVDASSEWDRSHLAGIWLGNATLRRVEVRGGTDALDFLTFTTEPTLTEGGWYHDTDWKSKATGATAGLNPDGQTHNDGAQYHRGSGPITMRGDLFENHNNAGLMISQVSADPKHHSSVILLDRLFFGGGMTTGINISVGNGDAFEGLKIVRPVFAPNPKAWLILRNPNTFRGQIGTPQMFDGTPAPISRGF